MKPRVSYSAVFGDPNASWMVAFDKLKSLPEGTKLYARDKQFTLDHVLDAPHPPSIHLKHRVHGRLQSWIVRRGDTLMTELSPYAKGGQIK